MLVSLGTACLSLAAVLADLPASEGASQGEETFPLSQLPPRGTGPVPIPFFVFSSY